MLTEKIDAEFLDSAPKLKVRFWRGYIIRRLLLRVDQVIGTHAVGYDNVDVAECTKRGVLVGNTPGVLSLCVCVCGVWLGGCVCACIHTTVFRSLSLIIRRC
jgi:phosphoglycerate dehydrogenase-like enzyme